MQASDELPPLAKANLTAAAIERLADQPNRADATRRIVDLAQTIDKIEPPAILCELNEDRQVAGFPPVPDADTVTAALETRRRYYRDVVRGVLDRLTTAELIQVVSEIVDRCTEGGTRHAPIIVQDLVDTYETGAQGFVEGETQNVDLLIERAKLEVKNGEPEVLRVIDILGDVASNWTMVTKPIQVL
jgi:hypothetical protein